MSNFYAEKIALLNAIKAELSVGIECVDVADVDTFGAIVTVCRDDKATLYLGVNNLDTRRDKCRLVCSLSAEGLVTREFKQAQVRSIIDPKAIASAVVAMMKLSFEVTTAKTTMLATALAAVKAAAPDAPVQDHRDAFSASIYGDLLVIAVELRGEEVILTVRDRSRSYSADILSVTPEQDFDAEKFNEYIGGIVASKREKYLKLLLDSEAQRLSDALARQLNDEYPLGCRGTHDPNKVVVDLGRSMTADQARQLGEFLKTLE
jgi:hypothetical protein